MQSELTYISTVADSSARNTSSHHATSTNTSPSTDRLLAAGDPPVARRKGRSSSVHNRWRQDAGQHGQMGLFVELETVGGHPDELAAAVGHVVLRSTELDYWACHLIATVLGDDDASWRKYWGRSGEQLADGLVAAAAHTELLAAAVSPFRSVSQRRNQVVHSLWFADGKRPDTYEAARPVIRSYGDTRDRVFTLTDLRTLASDVQRVSDYIWVLHSEWLTVRQYGTGEVVARTPIALPSLVGIEPPSD